MTVEEAVQALLETEWLDFTPEQAMKEIMDCGPDGEYAYQEYTEDTPEGEDFRFLRIWWDGESQSFLGSDNYWQFYPPKREATPQAHEFERSSLGLSVLCKKCRLMPLDQDDVDSECPGKPLD